MEGHQTSERIMLRSFLVVDCGIAPLLRSPSRNVMCLEKLRLRTALLGGSNGFHDVNSEDICELFYEMIRRLDDYL